MSFKIAYMIDRLHIGGTEGQLVALVNGLKARGHQPVIFTLVKGTPSVEEALQCPLVLLDVPSLGKPRGIATLFRFSRQLKQEKFDLVQTFFYDGSIFGILAAILAGVKHRVSSRRDIGFWYTPGKLRMMRFLNRFTQKILVNSAEVKKSVLSREKCPQEQLHIIYNGMPMLEDAQITQWRFQTRSALGIAERETVVGIVANLNRPVKRVDVFLSAAAMLAKDFPNVRFLIAGEGHLRPELEAQAEKAGITHLVRFLGSVRNPLQLIPAFDIGVNSSETEGFSNAVLECFNCRVPVVVSKTSGNEEMVEESKTGLFFEVNQPQSLAEQLANLLRDGAARERLAKAGRDQIRERFQLSRYLDAHEAFYQSLLGPVEKKR